MMTTPFELSNGKYKIACTKYIPANPLGIPVVMSHGFLSNQKRLRKYAIFLCELGYTVYTYDFCGGHLFGKSEGERSYMTLTHEMRDMEMVIANVLEDKRRLILFGESQGGFLSLLYASKNPAAVTRVLCVYPALCIPDDARRGKMLFMRFDPKDIDHTFKSKMGFHFSADYAREALLLDTDKILNEVLCPCCIICGAKDKIVNPAYGRKALESLSRDSFVYFLKKQGHGFNSLGIKEACQYFKEFLK